jgi:hypothetical protein
MSDQPLKSELPNSFTFSQTSLQDYADCPRRFQLRYLERLVWPAIEMEPVVENERRQQAGQAFHRLAQQHLIGLPEETLARMTDTPELKRWWTNYISDAELAGTRKDGARLYVEQALSAPIGTHHLLAKFDLVILTAAGKAIIYDWKTSPKRPRPQWMAARMQTCVYLAVLTQAGGCLSKGEKLLPEQVEMVYWFTEFPDEPVRFPYTTEQYRRDWEKLSALAQEIERERVFPMCDEDKPCDYCCYRSYCARGGKAGLIDQAEGEMDGQDGKFDLDMDRVAEIEF